MRLKTLIVPFAVTTTSAVVGYKILGGSVGMWIVGAWILNVPVTLAYAYFFPHPEAGRELEK